MIAMSLPKDKWVKSVPRRDWLLGNPVFLVLLQTPLTLIQPARNYATPPPGAVLSYLVLTLYLCFVCVVTA